MHPFGKVAGKPGFSASGKACHKDQTASCIRHPEVYLLSAKLGAQINKKNDPCHPPLLIRYYFRNFAWY
jgi:hypothetical protein